LIRSLKQPSKKQRLPQTLNLRHDLPHKLENLIKGLVLIRGKIKTSKKGLTIRVQINLSKDKNYQNVRLKYCKKDGRKALQEVLVKRGQRFFLTFL